MMRYCRQPLCVRMTRGLVLLLMPLLALMPLLHAHPLGSIDTAHPPGVHLPLATPAAVAARGAAAAPGTQPAAADAGSPATIVVQDLRQGAAGSPQPPSFAPGGVGMRASPMVAARTRRAGLRPDIPRLAPLMQAHRPQAPPLAAAAA
jgi:hypothetical protein